MSSTLKTRPRLGGVVIPRRGSSPRRVQLKRTDTSNGLLPLKHWKVDRKKIGTPNS